MIELIGQIPIKRSIGFRMKKTSLTIGLVTLVVAIILECIINNYYMIALLIPGLYLFNLRMKMGGSSIYKDVKISIQVEDLVISIIQENIISHKDKTYSVKYMFNKNMLKELSYSSNSLLSFIFNGKYELILNDNIVETKQLEKYNLSFYTSEEDASKIIKLLTEDR